MDRAKLALMCMSGRDVHQSLQEAMDAYPGEFRMEVSEGESGILIASIHGGNIEPGTSEMARAIGGDEHSRVDFQGLREGDEIYNWPLHVTSTNFSEPQADEAVGQSRICLSLHANMGRSGRFIYIGGRNRRLHRMLEVAYKERGFSVRPPYQTARGVDPRNYVNRAAEQGVQLTFSRDFLTGLDGSRQLFVDTTREVLRDYVARV